MKTIAEIQAKNGLWHALWEVAVDEANNAKDSQRRIDEINGLPERGVVDVYFTYHPEMREWTENHVTAGTCEAGINELRERLQVVRVQRAADRQRAQQRYRDGVPTAPVPPDDWMAPFKSGPAIWRINPPPLVIIGQEPAVVDQPLVSSTPLPEQGTSFQAAEISAIQQPVVDQQSGLDERPKKNSGGRPPTWNWVAFDGEIARVANTPDGLPERHSLTKHMLDWCMNEWGNTPAESGVRDRIARLKIYPD
jgi:hypothetical protein